MQPVKTDMSPNNYYAQFIREFPEFAPTRKFSRRRGKKSAASQRSGTTKNSFNILPQSKPLIYHTPFRFFKKSPSKHIRDPLSPQVFGFHSFGHSVFKTSERDPTYVFESPNVGFQPNFSTGAGPGNSQEHGFGNSQFCNQEHSFGNSQEYRFGNSSFQSFSEPEKCKYEHSVSHVHNHTHVHNHGFSGKSKSSFSKNSKPVYRKPETQSPPSFSLSPREIYAAEDKRNNSLGHVWIDGYLKHWVDSKINCCGTLVRGFYRCNPGQK